jgi:hypothetical protein
VQQPPAVPDHDSERAFAIMADEDIPERVAALEQFVRNNWTALNDIRADLRAIRSGCAGCWPPSSSCC